jgi:hypothetical protein
MFVKMIDFYERNNNRSCGLLFMALGSHVLWTMYRYFRFVYLLRRSEFLATDPEVPGSIPGPTRFSEKLGVWNVVQSAS